MPIVTLPLDLGDSRALEERGIVAICADLYHGRGSSLGCFGGSVVEVRARDVNVYYVVSTDPRRDAFVIMSRRFELPPVSVVGSAEVRIGGGVREVPVRDFAFRLALKRGLHLDKPMVLGRYIALEEKVVAEPSLPEIARVLEEALGLKLVAVIDEPGLRISLGGTCYSLKDFEVRGTSRLATVDYIIEVEHISTWDKGLRDRLSGRNLVVAVLRERHKREPEVSALATLLIFERVGSVSVEEVLGPRILQKEVVMLTLG